MFRNVLMRVLAVTAIALGATQAHANGNWFFYPNTAGVTQFSSPVIGNCLVMVESTTRPGGQVSITATVYGIYTTSPCYFTDHSGHFWIPSLSIRRNSSESWSWPRFGSQDVMVSGVTFAYTALPYAGFTNLDLSWKSNVQLSVALCPNNVTNSSQCTWPWITSISAP